MPASSHFQQENVLSSTFFPILFNLYFLAQFSYTLIDFFFYHLAFHWASRLKQFIDFFLIHFSIQNDLK